MAAIWIPNQKIYNKFQQLKTFVDFVAGLEYATQNDKLKAVKIKSLIETINKPDTFQN